MILKFIQSVFSSNQTSKAKATIKETDKQNQTTTQVNDKIEIICQSEVNHPAQFPYHKLKRRNPIAYSTKIEDYIKPIGLTISACPSCGVELNKFPLRKTKCKDCGESIYSWKRPYDEKKVLLNEVGTKEINKQTLIISRGLENYLIELEDFEAIREILAEARNIDINLVPDSDVNWLILNREGYKSQLEQKFNETHSTTIMQALHLLEEERYKEAISFLLLIFYFEINGEYVYDDNDLTKKHWNTDYADINSYHISLLKKCITETKTDTKNLKKNWFRISERNKDYYGFVVSEADGWELLSRTLNLNI